MKVRLAIGAATAVVVISVGLAAALPGEAVFPANPSPSPMPSMSTQNWLEPEFPWRAGIAILGAIVAMAAIAVVARAVEKRRAR